MSPFIATLLTAFGVIYLLRRESLHGEVRSPALWLPVLWLIPAGSRFVSQWMNLEGGSGGNFYEGSAIDAVYFAALILVSFWVIMQRVSLTDAMRANGWIVALAVFGLASVLWSDHPLIATKRWVKTLGHPLVALIILTEPDPVAAVRTVLKRCAYFLLPVSVLFIKYLPEYGRGFDAWTGEATNNGAGLTKNDLGYLCMVFGIVFVWNLLTLDRLKSRRERRAEAVLSVMFLWMTFWLLGMANSATSLVTICVAITVLVGLGTPLVSRRHFGIYMIVALLFAFIAEASFGVYEQIIAMLGRNPNLTDRTVVWSDVLALQDMPLFGYGFESFWLGERLDVLWSKWWWRPTQAHNGYIEMYLNLGLIGLFLLSMVLLTSFRSISRQLQTDFVFARLRLALLFAVILFNYTEAGFKGVHFMWTIFHIVAMEVPRRRATMQRSVTLEY